MSALAFVGLFVLAFAGGNGSGWLLGHKRAYAECCDCCTCELCDPAGDRLTEVWRNGYEQGCDDESRSYDDPLPRMALASAGHREAVPVDSLRPDQDAGRGRAPVEDPGAASPVPGQDARSATTQREGRALHGLNHADTSRPGPVTEQLPAANKGRPGPGRYPDGRRIGFTYGAGTGYEDEPCAGELAGGRYPDGREYPTAPRIVNPELAALASDSSQIDGEPTETITRVEVPDLWLETVLMGWESRYPIHQEA